MKSIGTLLLVAIGAVAAQNCGAGIGSCGPGFCCSSYNWCGIGFAWCDVGCQSEYGTCNSGSQTSSTSSTSSSTAAPTSTSTVQPPPTQPPVSNGVSIVTQCTVPNTVAITFDDGPYQWMQQIANAFNNAGGHVTFFVNGLNWDCIYNNAETLQAVEAAGNQIASHTWSHPDITTLTPDQLSTELSKLNDALSKILGKIPVFFRPPYGSWDDQSLQVLQQQGFQYNVLWDIDSGDSLGASVASQMNQYNTASTSSSHIFLQHETYATTANDMVPFIINWANQRGLRMVTVAECLGQSLSSAYRITTGVPGTRDSTWVC